MVVDTLRSRALEGNRIGDTMDRKVTVYLPPAYDRNPAQRFPVVYLLHGFTSDPVEWLDGTYQGLNLSTALDQQAGAGATQYIVVMPLTNNAVGGAFYVNSAAFGNWDDFVTKELVAFVDARYRTLPSRASRVLAGQSMGGFGALYLAGRHPDVFAHVYAMSACCTGFVGDLAATGSRWQGEPRGWHRAMAMAFAAEPPSDPLTAPLTLPFVKGDDGAMHEVPAVAASWRAFMPLYRLMQDPEPYKALCSIGLEAGAQDEISNVPAGSRAFSDALNRAGIMHTYVEFPGGHVDRTRDRFERAVLPFFARVLATDQSPGACRQ